MTFAFWNLVSGRVNSLSTASVEIITQACLEFTCVTVLSTEELGCQGGALMERVAWGKVEVIGVFWRQWWWCSRSCIYLVPLKVRGCHEDEFMGWGSFRKGEWTNRMWKRVLSCPMWWCDWILFAVQVIQATILVLHLEHQIWIKCCFVVFFEICNPSFLSTVGVGTFVLPIPLELEKL